MISLRTARALLRHTAETNRQRQQTDDALRQLAPIAPPVDLRLRLQVALSHERVRTERGSVGRVQHRLAVLRSQFVRPVRVQMAVAGAAFTVAICGAAWLGAVAPQQSVEANDTPLDGFSAPVYLYSAAGETPVYPADEAPLIVQAQVDSRGRVYDYRVLSGHLNDEARAALQQRMLAGVFKPAHVLGEPVRGSVVLTFADVQVRG